MDVKSVSGIKDEAKIIKPKEKIIKYDLNTIDGQYSLNIIIDFYKLKKIVLELKEFRYIKEGSNEVKATYLEYILKNLLSIIQDKNFKYYKTVTFEKNSNNMINSIINYEKFGELDTNSERVSVVNLSEYKRNFDVEMLRDLYERVKKCIRFRVFRRELTGINGELGFDEIQGLHKK